jgi:glycosyltransferase involved in cell wall biosynthesis
MTTPAGGQSPLLSIVVPAFNEERTIAVTIERVRAALANHEIEIIVVDDASADGTVEALAPFDGDRLRVIRHERNRGKGAALRSGFAVAAGEIIAVQDADLENDPDDLPGLLAPILDGRADVVYGARWSGARGPQRVGMFWHLAGNRFLTFVTNVLYNTTLSDMETGYKVMRREVLTGMRLRSEDFTIEPELTAKILKAGRWRIYEAPISYHPRTFQEGKKITWRHGITALIALIRYRFLD